MSCFGEIVEPSSRALWEDCDGENESLPDLAWASEVQAERVKLFILVEGRLLNEYVRDQIGTSKVTINKMIGANVEICRLPSQVLVCFCQCDDLLRSSEIVELLTPYLEASEEVGALQSRALAEYKHPMRQEAPCIVRSLRTGSSTHAAGVVRLEQPNIVSGVAAGVLSAAAWRGRECALHVCYTEACPDARALAALRAVTQPLLSAAPPARAYHPSYTAQPNLYM